MIHGLRALPWRRWASMSRGQVRAPPFTPAACPLPLLPSSRAPLPRAPHPHPGRSAGLRADLDAQGPEGDADGTCLSGNRKTRVEDPFCCGGQPGGRTYPRAPGLNLVTGRGEAGGRLFPKPRVPRAVPLLPRFPESQLPTCPARGALLGRRRSDRMHGAVS